MKGVFSKAPRVLVGLLIVLGYLMVVDVGGEAISATYPEWRINLRNTLRSDYYSISGDTENSIYTYDERWMTYDETDLRVEKHTNPYDLFRLNFYGVWSDSPYRTGDERGFIPERINLFKEQGDVTLPYRIEAGDYYAYFSYRTIQQSLKGVQIELQPLWWRDKGVRSSFVYLIGANQPSWRGFTVKENLSQGVSYLIETSKGRYTFNLVHNRRFKKSGVYPEDYQQTTYSVAMEQNLPGKILLETEAAYFYGDYPDEAFDREDWGLFLQIQNRPPGIGWSYRFRAESYGKDFRPEGSLVTPDRRSCEFHLGYRFLQGIQTRGRLQYYKDKWQSDNPIITKIAGFSLSGDIGPPRLTRPLNINLDTFLQHREDKLGTLNDSTRSLNLNLAYPLLRNMNLRTNYLFTRTTHTSREQQISLGLDIFTLYNTWRLNFSPNLSYQKSTVYSTKTEAWSMGFNWEAIYNQHRFYGSTSYKTQNNWPGEDINTYNYNLMYECHFRKRHTFSLEFQGEHRGVHGGDHTDTYRVSVWWTYNFERSIHPTRKKVVLREKPEKLAKLSLSPGLFAHLYPGLKTKKALKVMTDLGLKTPLLQGNMLIYEVRLFEEIEQRQRLILIDEGGVLRKTVLVFDYVDKSQFHDFWESFQRIKEAMIRIYGAPDDFLEQGEISKNFVQDINSGKVIRVYEWNMEYGHLRLGIPRRMDQKVRVEIHYAREFPPYSVLNWGLERLY